MSKLKQFNLILSAMLLLGSAILPNQANAGQIKLDCRQKNLLMPQLICSNPSLKEKFNRIASIQTGWQGDNQQEVLKFLLYYFLDDFPMLLDELPLSDVEKRAYRLIFTVVNNPEKLDGEEFAENAKLIHEFILQEIEDTPYIYQYESSVEEDYLKCYQNKCCLLTALSVYFADYIIIPCTWGQECHVLDFTALYGCANSYYRPWHNCDLYPQFDLPKEVADYVRNLTKDDYYDGLGTSRCTYPVWTDQLKTVKHYDPEQGELDRVDITIEEPFLYWALESYPNWQRYQKAYHEGIGYPKALEYLINHYRETFHLSPCNAKKAALNLLMTDRMYLYKTDKENDVRYLILSGQPWEKIKLKLELLNKNNPTPDHTNSTTGVLAYDPQNILSVAIQRPDILEKLLKTFSWLDVNLGDELDKTPLMYASQYNFFKSVKILTEYGADLNLQTVETNCYSTDTGEACMRNGKRTALMYAVQEGNFDIAIYLITHGADIRLTDKKGHTAYDYLMNKVFKEGFLKQYMYPQYAHEPQNPKDMMTENQFAKLKMLLKVD